MIWYPEQITGTSRCPAAERMLADDLRDPKRAAAR